VTGVGSSLEMTEPWGGGQGTNADSLPFSLLWTARMAQSRDMKVAIVPAIAFPH
jgi:hypothetical protein